MSYVAAPFSSFCHHNDTNNAFFGAELGKDNPVIPAAWTISKILCVNGYSCTFLQCLPESARSATLHDNDAIKMLCNVIYLLFCSLGLHTQETAVSIYNFFVTAAVIFAPCGGVFYFHVQIARMVKQSVEALGAEQQMHVQVLRRVMLMCAVLNAIFLVSYLPLGVSTIRVFVTGIPCAILCVLVRY